MIKIEIETIDRSSEVIWDSISVEQNLTSLVDKASFTIRKYGSRTYTPKVSEEVVIYDGTEKIFAGTIQNFKEGVETSEGVVYDIECVDWTYDFNSNLVSESYESMTIAEIIAHIVDNYAPDFTYDNVSSEFEIEKIVFNRIEPGRCIKRLADIVSYEWYIDEDKDVHFFSREENTAPFDLQDDSGNYIYKSLSRKVDGSQLANVVYVCGGEFNGDLYTDEITVSGSDSKSFSLPYKFANLTIELDTGGGYVSQDVGIDFIDDFTTDDVLYNYNEKTIRWETALSDGDKIRFSGNPKIPVMSVASDSASIAEFGEKEKIIRDNSIEDLDTARRRATAELNIYSNEIEDASFKTYTSGLRSGMLINLTSVNRDCNTDFIIKKLKMIPADPNRFIYSATLITTKKYELTELLRLLMEPESRQSDDAEVAEKIQLDGATVSISEAIEAILASTDIFTITITETVTRDALGTDTEPDWVLAPYIPSPYPTDTKRVGLLDYSLEVY